MPFAGPLRSGRSELMADGRSVVSGLKGCAAEATVVALRKAARRIRTNARILCSTAAEKASFPALTEAYKSSGRAATPPELRASLQDIRGEVRQARALPPDQCDVPGMRPPAEPVHRIGEPGGRLREIGGVDLSHVAEARQLGTGSGPGNERLHLLRGEVLRLIQDEETVEERPPAHEVERADLDPVAQQIVRCRAAPVAAFLPAGEHFQIVHQRSHPGLHLL